MIGLDVFHSTVQAGTKVALLPNGWIGEAKWADTLLDSVGEHATMRQQRHDTAWSQTSFGVLSLVARILVIYLIAPHGRDGNGVLQCPQPVDAQCPACSAFAFDPCTVPGTLALQGRSLSNLNPSWFNDAACTSFTQLQLNNNFITTIPAGSFTQLTNLTHLFLNSNLLATLTSGIFDMLTSLQMLVLNNNALTTLPAGIFDNLSSLSELGVTDNDLPSLLPNIFDGLMAMQYLYLSGNLLTSLSPIIFDALASLQWLYVDRNQLTQLPPGIFDQTISLSVLVLNDNVLEALPANIFGALMALSGGDLRGNPWNCSTHASAILIPGVLSFDSCMPQRVQQDFCGITNPCQNGGSCINGLAGVVCVCAVGFLGPTCSSPDFCATSPCLNGGSCSSMQTTFVCSCIPPFIAPLCAHDYCSSSPCKNGGTCGNDITTFVCGCAAGWEGVDCSTEVVGAVSLILYAAGGSAAVAFAVGLLWKFYCRSDQPKKNGSSRRLHRRDGLDGEAADGFSDESSVVSARSDLSDGSSILSEYRSEMSHSEDQEISRSSISMASYRSDVSGASDRSNMSVAGVSTYSDVSVSSVRSSSSIGSGLSVSMSSSRSSVESYRSGPGGYSPRSPSSLQSYKTMSSADSSSFLSEEKRAF